VKVLVEVLDQRGRCQCGHRRGETWETIGKTPEGICIAAFSSLIPWIHILWDGHNPEWSEDGLVKVSCPDPKNPVVFGLRMSPD